LTLGRSGKFRPRRWRGVLVAGRLGLRAIEIIAAIVAIAAAAGAIALRMRRRGEQA
jgi:hypothetical protein